MSDTKVFVGKEILRLITTAMYDSPLSIYREYVQNSVDAMDDAVAKGGYDKDNAEICINIAHAERCITIRDNGPGVLAKKFPERMKTIGWSEKNGTSLRGIWGIGRLAGLAYCKHLVFQTKAHGEKTISQIEWDGQKFRGLLSASGQSMDLPEIVEQIATISSEKVAAEQPAFFEVQVNQVVRHGNDALLNEEMVGEYLAQVAPVPFHDDAPFGKQIKAFLMPHVDVTGHRIYLNEKKEPIYKPHQTTFVYSKNHQDRFFDFEPFAVKCASDKLSAVGWILHHSYMGALKNSPLIRGMRVRSGNMQIGDERILSGIFPEERFNGWSVGELHILDPLLRPNGQRSNLEDTPAFRSLKNKLTPIVGRNIAKKCRDNSIVRNKIRRTLEQLNAFDISMDILEEGVLSPKKANEISAHIELEVNNSLSDQVAISSAQQDQIRDATEKILARLEKVRKSAKKSARFNHLSKTRLNLLNAIADLIYEHSPNPKVKSELIFRIRALVEGEKK